MAQKTVLVITDGIGYSEQKEYNAFFHAKKPTYDRLFKDVPYGMVATYGSAVGLPDGQMGNSEVGHMTIGSGRVSYQDLVKVTKAFDDNTFGENEVVKTFSSSVTRVHLVGLVSDGGVHSHIDHLKGLVNHFSNQEVIIHIITDGRDTAPTSGVEFVAEVEKLESSHVKIGSIGGRFFAMDRDKRWDRVEKGYNAIVEGAPKCSLSSNEYLKNQYENGFNDEFVEPVALGGYEGIKEGDGVVFYNFRSDRMRQLVDVFGNEKFDGFERKYIKTSIITMTQYAKEFPFPVIFPKEEPKNVLAEVISHAGLKQFHTAETEKYAHVTFFLNGGREEPFVNETRLLIPSPKVKTYDEKPEMSANEVGQSVLTAMDEGYDFVVVNFANGDMVGHTGDFDAGIKAVETVDANLEKIIEKAKELDYAIVLTSDHGNCEEMKNLTTQEMLTNHTVGDVWCFVMAHGVTQVKNGALNNIAPTVLKVIGLEIPAVMDEPLI